MKVAQILKGKKVHKDVSLVIAPGSRQVMEMISRNGALADIISSGADLMKVAQILKGKKVHKDVSLVIAPGSRQVMEMISRNGALADIISSGARILENSCGPCIGMGIHVDHV